MCTHTPPHSQAGQGSCRGLTNVAPRPAPRLGEAVEPVQTQSEKPCEGLRPQVASCLVSFMLASAPPLEPPRAPWRPQAGVGHYGGWGPLSCPGPISSLSGVASRQHPWLATCGAGLWVFKSSFHVVPSLPVVLAQDSPWAWPAGSPGQPGWAAHADCWGCVLGSQDGALPPPACPGHPALRSPCRREGAGHSPAPPGFQGRQPSSPAPARSPCILPASGGVRADPGGPARQEGLLWRHPLDGDLAVLLREKPSGFHSEKSSV